MTANDRIFIRRHLAAFAGISDDKDHVRRAVIRTAAAYGISISGIARYFRMTFKTAAKVSGATVVETELQTARRAIDRAKNELRMAEGRERAVLERMELYGFNQHRNHRA